MLVDLRDNELALPDFAWFLALKAGINGQLVLSRNNDIVQVHSCFVGRQIWRCVGMLHKQMLNDLYKKVSGSHQVIGVLLVRLVDFHVH